MAKSKPKSTPRSAAKKKTASKSKSAGRQPATKQKKALSSQAQWNRDVAENTRIVAPIGDELRPLWERLIEEVYSATKSSWPRSASASVVVWELVSALLIERDSPEDQEMMLEVQDPRVAAILEKCFPAAKKILERYERTFKMTLNNVDINGTGKRTIQFCIDAVAKYETSHGRNLLFFDALLAGSPRTLYAIQSEAVYDAKPGSLVAVKKKFDTYWKKAKQKL